MNFKPNKWKVIVSITAVIIWIFIANTFFYNFMCKLCEGLVCETNYIKYYLMQPPCGYCSCHLLKDVMLSNAKTILIPFILVYITWSLFEKNKKRKR